MAAAQPLAMDPTHAPCGWSGQQQGVSNALLRFGNALRTQRGTWSFAPGALPAMTTARLAQPAERKALNLVVVGSSPTVGAFEFLREAIVGAFAGGYALLCAQARRGRGGAAALARQLVWHACARGGSSGERKHMGSKRVVFAGVCVSRNAAAWMA